MERPDLSQIDPEIRKYIEYLEKKLGLSDQEQSLSLNSIDLERRELPAEPETSSCIVTISNLGNGKRTFRHLYSRQHRGGMGVFDLVTSPSEIPSILSAMDDGQYLILLTNKARAYRLSLANCLPSPVHARGSNLIEKLFFDPDEHLVTVLPEQAKGYLTLVGESGRIRCLRHHLFGEHMKQGTTLFPIHEFGPLVTANWTTGDSDLLLVTRQGIGIRFSEKLISPQGDIGMKVAADDRIVAVNSVYPDSGVFVISEDGKGAIRLMRGFAPNKSPGGSGKIVMRSSCVIGAVTIDADDELFLITRLGKIIRFMANEVPASDSPVQGVSCIALRSDVVTALLKINPNR